MSRREFQGKVAVVTGGGSGLGKACAELLGSQGASVFVNDERNGGKDALAVVELIRSRGGTAVANGNSVLAGDTIIETAIAALGSIDILINAAVYSPKTGSIVGVNGRDWDVSKDVQIKGSYKTINAAWKHFRAQGYGRVVNVSSLAALHGLPQQAVECTTNHSQIGYSFTLAKEGAKKNIFVNVVFPVGGPTDNEASAAAFVSFLVHERNKTENGGAYELGGGRVAKLRWQRSGGLLLRADDSLGPEAVIKGWSRVVDFERPEYPSGPNKFLDLLNVGLKLPVEKYPASISFKDRAVLITGAGSGLGRAYALHFARLGASVMVNDIADPSSVVDEIHQMGGIAAGTVGSAEEGQKHVQATIEAFGRIDVVVNNAGILRDKAFHNMSESMWDPVLSVHLQGTYNTCRAAWPYFVKQKHGRIVNTTSVTGIYGSFGQANYAAAKSAIIGLTRALAREGAQHNILANVIAPNAGTNMTKSILSDEVSKALKPDHVAPLVSALSGDAAPSDPTGGVYEVGSGWFGKTRWERQPGWSLVTDGTSLDDILAKLSSFAASQPTYPTSVEDHMRIISREASNSQSTSAEKVLANIRRAKEAKPQGSIYTYTERDLILYALSIGAHHSNLPLVWEGHKDFTALPVFGLIPFFNAKLPYKMEDLMLGYDQRMLLHVDQYLEIRSPIPPSGELRTFPKLIQVVDKGRDAMVVQGFTTVTDKNQEVFFNETTVLVRGSGGFGGDSVLADRGAATARNNPPSRAPDVMVEEKTHEGQAALYRLNGDLNPLHIDPEFSQKGGFKVPILHGLCSLGIAGKHIFQTYGSYRSVKARFTSVVLPGQTLQTEMWKENNKVVFQVLVKETGKKAISGGAVELYLRGASFL
ncbi:hypothetical protein NW759_002743 [Fusarium solani]|uniref:Ketoreductase domain-containing protein n=1 Tax=Fusarium solani TaxID=169388 RepID=A0A9P9HM77_FUSSL|nr:uncharacterized protein B0J15DRAFT_581772 [Fusarium solani]KAH7259806.1 hypothetical protein B0J15DRAFT_581772 [Fusarium solani]KAJ4232356.1 hypothetical protein NW759_002743 [Fusarium solani]